MAADDGLDDLYAAAPSEFVARREELVKARRAQGDIDEAAAVHQLRKPTLVAWSVNQVARTRPRDVRALVVAGDELRAAIASGDGDRIRTAMRVRRTRVDELTDAAIEEARAIVPDRTGHRDAIAATFEAATADDDARDLVTRGRLTTGRQTTSTMLDDLVALTPARRAPTRATGLPRARGAALPRDELAQRRAEDAVKAARAELKAAAVALRAAESDAARAERTAEAARDAHRRAEGKLERARRALDDRRAR